MMRRLFREPKEQRGNPNYWCIEILEKKYAIPMPIVAVVSMIIVIYLFERFMYYSAEYLMGRM